MAGSRYFRSLCLSFLLHTVLVHLVCDMVLSRGSQLFAESRPSNENAITASIAATAVDEEQNRTIEERTQSDSGQIDEKKNVTNTAWGKHGRVWMWIGYVPPLEIRKYSLLTTESSIALMWTILYVRCNGLCLALAN